MPDGLTYKYYHKLRSRTVYLVLHGGGPEGIETPFISSILEALTATGNSVLGFNFPYCERGEISSSGPELREEVAALDAVVHFLRGSGYEQIVIVAKSLGGITASYWLEQHPDAQVEVVILGYVIGSVKTEALRNKLRLVIQGERDRFGDAAALREALAEHHVDADIAAVADADHSYRNEQKEPVYQGTAVRLLVGKLREL